MLKKGESGAVDAAFVCVVMNNFFTITVTGAQAPLDASPLGCVPSASAAGALPAPPASGASWSGTLRLQGTGLAAGLDRFRGSSKLKYGRCDGGDVEFDDESVP